jgi:phosphatidylglycerophosphate synthase
MKSEARKLPQKYENPIDNILVGFAEKLNPIFYKLGFNPNGITTLSLIFGILFNYYYYTKNYGLASIMIMISYFFDCMDGNFARTYNMQTKFGDYYDHIKDVLVMVIFAGILFLYASVPKYYKFAGLAIAILMTFGVMMHVGCTEKYVLAKKLNNIDPSGFLDNFQNTCAKIDDMKYLKYFGCGTFNVFIALFVLGHKYF